ncbi:MAG: DUF4340 domain-containing protein [candidate division Zixibacteria bacterium]
MNKKMIYVLAGLFIALLVISYVQKSFDRATESPETLNELSLNFESEIVAGIDIFKQDYPDSGLHFVKSDAGWLVTNEYNSPAKEEDVQKLIDDLGALSGSVRGESADLYEDFEITDEKALQIEFHDADDNKLLHLYIGKGGGTGRECFVRLAGSPIIYLANENFISRFAAWQAPPEKRLPTDRWLQLELCAIDRTEISSFEIVKGKKHYVFANVDEASDDSLAPPTKVWKQILPEKGLKLDESKIRSLSSSIATLRASGVVDPANQDKFGLNRPKNILRAGDNTSKEVEISVSDPVNDDGERYVVVKGREGVYKIDKNTFERFFVKPFEADK